MLLKAFRKRETFNLAVPLRCDYFGRRKRKEDNNSRNYNLRSHIIFEMWYRDRSFSNHKHEPFQKDIHDRIQHILIPVHAVLFSKE